MPSPAMIAAVLVVSISMALAWVLYDILFRNAMNALDAL
jgi:hypothetical protein